MAIFKGELDGYVYETDWARASADRVTWSAVVKFEGEWVASPSGMLHRASQNDREVTAAVRLSVETDIHGRFNERR
jgi:hypothetical protein